MRRMEIFTCSITARYLGAVVITRRNIERRMPTSEERLKILQMIQRGEITAESGFRLLEELDLGAVSPTPESTPAEAKQQAHWFHLVVSELTTGKIRIDLRLPLRVVTTGMKMGARLSPEVDKIKPEELRDILSSGETGKIVDVYDETDGERIEIFLE
jgi:hypothetical protein